MAKKKDSKNETTAIVLVVDRSGSMMTIAKATEDALKEFINGQKELSGHLSVDTVFYDSQYEERESNVDPKTKELDLSINPRGMTAMYDAIGRKITQFSEFVKDSKKKFDHILFVIATDGQENSSVEYTQQTVADLITQKQKEKWNFTFIGANQDAVLAAKGLNIAEKDAITFAASNAGVSSVIQSVNSYATVLRGGGVAAYNDLDRKEAMDEAK